MYEEHPTPEDPVRSYVADGFTVLELNGEVDIASGLRIAPLLDCATAPSDCAVAVDLTAVTFLDCHGLNLLCRARRRAHERDGRLVLICDSPPVLRLLRLTGLLTAFRPAPTLAEALDDFSPSAS